MNPMLRPELGVRTGDCSRQKCDDDCVPQKETKMPSESTKERGREKEESKFVISLISHTLQIGVYCNRVKEAGGGVGLQDEWV